jgi:membrane fusion protein (multidrug efflux system)
MIRTDVMAFGFPILLAGSLALTGCGKQPAAHREATLPAAAVKAQAIERKPRQAVEDVVGTVRAKLRAVVEAKVSGKIDELLVVPGQAVKRGELLASIEAREIQARLDQANAIRQQAESELKRLASLFEQKILSQAEYDAAQSKFRVADGAVKEAETQLGYMKVTAPFDGVITRKLADVGDLAAPGKPLLGIEDARVLRLEADVPEALIGRIALGDKVAVTIPSLSNRSLEGVVSELSPAADPGSRTFLAKFDLPSSEGLRAGQFGRVAIPLGESTALRVPAAAVLQRGQMEIVFIAADGRAQLRLVKTGKRIGDEVELISGVEAGERIVVEGVASLLDGQPLSIGN